jgi:hypothetical protein
VGRSKGKRPHGRPRHRWEDIKLHLRGIRWCDMDWIDVALDRDQWQTLMNMIMNLASSIKHWEILEKLSSCWLCKKGWFPWS